MTPIEPLDATFPGKAAARRAWLDQVIDQLADAEALCGPLEMPGLARRIVDARAAAAALRGNAS